MPISTVKNELFKTGPISFSGLRSTLGGSQNDIKFSDYYRNTNVDDTNPLVPDATENQKIPSKLDNDELNLSDFRGVIKEYQINQTGTNPNLDLGQLNIVDENNNIIGYTGPWNGNLNKNIIKKVLIDGTCYATAVGRYGVNLVSDVSNLNFEVSDNGAIYGSGGDGGNPGNAPQTSIRTASMYHVFVNSTDQTIDSVTSGGVTISVMNAWGPDGLKLNGDVTSSTALYAAKHYRVTFDEPYLDTNYTILVTNVSQYTAGGGYGLCVVEGIGDKRTDGFRVWFKRTVAPGAGGVNANTYVRSFFVETEGKSASSITPVNFTLTSTSFLDGDFIPLTYYLPSSGGTNKTPQLSWSLTGLPSGVSISSYQIYIEDLSTANSFRLWELENIPKNVNSISDGQTVAPSGTTIIPNDHGTSLSNSIGYGGPNPPAGEIHHYRLTVSAILSGSASKPTASLDFYAGSGTLIADKNSPINQDVSSVAVGSGSASLGTPGGPGGDGGGALYLNNIRQSSSQSARFNIKLNPNAKIWAGGGGGTGGKPGKNGPIITCYSTTTFTNSPSTGGGGSRNCPSNDNCPSGSNQVSCNPNDTRSRCRGSSPRRGESGYVCAGNWTRTCQFTSSNLAQGLGGSGGKGGLGRGYQTINASLAGSQGTSPTSDSCSGSTSSGTVGEVGASGGDWGQDGGGAFGGKRGAAITGTKYNIIGKTTTNFRGSVIDL